MRYVLLIYGSEALAREERATIMRVHLAFLQEVQQRDSRPRSRRQSDDYRWPIRRNEGAPRRPLHPELQGLGRS